MKRVRLWLTPRSPRKDSLSPDMSGAGPSAVGGQSESARRMATRSVVAPGDERPIGARAAGTQPIRLVLYVKGFPPRETGGPAEVAFHLASGFLRTGNVRLTLVVQSDSTEEEIRGLLGCDDNLSVLRLPYFPTSRELFTLRPVVQAFASADLIHFNEFPFRHLALVVLAKARGVPVVFSMHGLLSEEIRTFLGPAYPVTFREGSGSIRLRFPRAAIRVLLSVYRSCGGAWNAVVVPSEALKRDATSSEHVSPGRIAVIPHGVEAPAATPRATTPHSGPLRILYVGKLEAVKGPDLLIDAVGRLLGAGIPVDLSVVGAGSLEASLRARAATLDRGRIAFLGVRRGEDLESLYAASDIVVVPSRHETLSMVALEAMAAGRPLLATDVGGIPEIARDPRNALLVRPDPDALADGLRRLIEEPELRAAMGKANLADSRRRSWSDVVDRYLLLYGGLLSRADVAAAGPA